MLYDLVHKDMDVFDEVVEGNQTLETSPPYRAIALSL